MVIVSGGLRDWYYHFRFETHSIRMYLLRTPPSRWKSIIIYWIRKRISQWHVHRDEYHRFIVLGRASVGETLINLIVNPIYAMYFIMMEIDVLGSSVTTAVFWIQHLAVLWTQSLGLGCMNSLCGSVCNPRGIRKSSVINVNHWEQVTRS